MKKILEICLDDYPNFIHQLTVFADKFSHASVLISNEYPDEYGKYELLAGIGNHQLLDNGKTSLKNLKDQINSKKWWFGHLGYDLKNEIEQLSSRKEEKFKFGALTFFEPQLLVRQLRGSSTVQIFKQIDVDSSILDTLFAENRALEIPSTIPSLSARISKSEYLKALENIRKEIQYGNIYEINYCQEFFTENANLNPQEVFIRLNKKSPMPFSAFYKTNTEYLLCASPERYLKKEGEDIISQPIKGTGRRGSTKKEDARLSEELRKDLKEQTENVMIVDLVRNDLSRTAKKASVGVKELFGVYQFPQVNQLISTITSKLDERYDLVDVIRTSFPMGSMTGAPKISAMQIADRLEESRRELYSGAVGYIDPDGNFDFNVVIRSLLYSKKSHYLSLTVGGAITAMSDSEKEYEECLLKAKAIFEL